MKPESPTRVLVADAKVGDYYVLLHAGTASEFTCKLVKFDRDLSSGLCSITLRTIAPLDGENRNVELFHLDPEMFLRRSVSISELVSMQRESLGLC